MAAVSRLWPRLRSALTTVVVASVLVAGTGSRAVGPTNAASDVMRALMSPDVQELLDDATADLHLALGDGWGEILLAPTGRTPAESLVALLSAAPLRVPHDGLHDAAIDAVNDAHADVRLAAMRPALRDFFATPAGARLANAQFDHRAAAALDAIVGAVQIFGINLDRIAKYGGTIASAVAIGAGLAACGLTVVCVAAAVTSTLVLGTITVIQLRNDATHHVEMRPPVCPTPTRCDWEMRAQSTASFARVGYINGAAFLFRVNIDNSSPLSSSAFNGDFVSVVAEGSEGGLHKYRLSGYLDETGSSNSMPCWLRVDVESQVIWSDGYASTDDAASGKPAEGNAYC